MEQTLVKARNHAYQLKREEIKKAAAKGKGALLPRQCNRRQSLDTALAKDNRILHYWFARCEAAREPSSEGQCGNSTLWKLLHFYGSFYRIPVVVFLLHHISNLGVVALAATVLSSAPTDDSSDPSWPSSAIVLALVQLSQLLDGLGNALRGRQHRAPTNRCFSLDKGSGGAIRFSLMNKATVTNSLFAAWLVCQGVATEARDGRFIAAQVCLSLFTIVQSLDTLTHLLSQVYPAFGVLVIALERMVGSLGSFVSYTLVLGLSFAIGLFGLTQIGTLRDAYDEGVLDRNQWYMLPYFAFIAPPLSNIDNFDGASSLIMLAYLFITSKVLQSLLMAIFASAHSRVFKDSALEYALQTCAVHLRFHHSAPLLPPPCNLLLALPLYNIVMGLCGRWANGMQSTKLVQPYLEALGQPPWSPTHCALPASVESNPLPSPSLHGVQPTALFQPSAPSPSPLR